MVAYYSSTSITLSIGHSFALPILEKCFLVCTEQDLIVIAV